MFLKPIVCVLVLSVLVSGDKEATRKIEVEWNPGCSLAECGASQNGSYVNVLYVKATGDKDIVHYLYSTFGTFTVLVFRSDLNGKLNIDWANLLDNKPDSISVTGSKIQEKAGYLVPLIYEFKDTDGKGDMTQVSQNKSNWNFYETSELVWLKFIPDNSSFIGKLEGHLKDDVNSTFSFIIRNTGDNSRDKSLPHLLLTPEACSLDFVINTPATWHLSKFAVEFLYLSSAETVSLSSKTTMDDEYTPGTFKLWNLEFNNANTTENFFQAKPIFYFFEPRALENSTLSLKYDMQNNLPLPEKSIAGGLFDEKTQGHAMNVSFGIEGGEKDAFFHSQTNYTIWSFTVGLGPAPVEKMSFLVTIVIAVGFGLPAAIIILGIFIMIVKKIRGSRRSEFEPLN